jgi:hypothetical protein
VVALRLTKVFGRGANLPHWSPDGRGISIFCCDDGMAAHIVDARTRSFRELPPADAQPETHCGPWSADGRRLACESFGVTEAGRTGIYSIRAGDAQGLSESRQSPTVMTSPATTPRTTTALSSSDTIPRAIQASR